ncbi:YaiO family outer membrane beta-barrel protein [Aquimarina brevivitae]|uniref:YaiO family outer membrane protein n=1 Tax=Aquimarina brevivitae TaxID=323412 RepID=A0A4Q7NUL7_9FLAO|nr:YaiO family outer membrane beta-barrel protein [Aquimarina brevivitae]RZS90548.1 YaiO family outer membrane protein [Aquimarina brevivitae]
MLVIKKYSFFILILLSITVTGQDKQFNGDPDEAFGIARELAFNDKRAQAQDTLRLILTKYPDYHDIRSFLASTYSWDGAYDDARKEFAYVLKKDAKRETTWEAAIKNELYAEKPFAALKMANEALTHFPKSPVILYQKASAQEATKNPEDALRTLEELLKNNPDYEKGQTYKKSLLSNLRHNVIGIRSAVEVYSDVFDPMQYHFLKYSRQTKYGSIHGRLNFNRRFNTNGLQAEVDLYPRIVEGVYAYLNFGVSNSSLFPDIRYGAEVYTSLPKSFEASAGFRALQFDETTMIYTGSVGKYAGNSYFSLRSYVTPDEAGASISGEIAYRKYGRNADNYFLVETGIGFSPENNRFVADGSDDEVISLRSQKFNLGYFFTSKNNKNAWGVRAGVVHQEIIFDPGNYLWIVDVAFTWDLRFK